MTKACCCCACWTRPSLWRPEFQRGAGNPKRTWMHNQRPDETGGEATHPDAQTRAAMLVTRMERGMDASYGRPEEMV